MRVANGSLLSVSALAVVACNGILGIEEPIVVDGGSGGTDAGSSATGGAQGAGGSSSGGNPGSGGASGADASSGGTGGVTGSGGASGTGGSSAGDASSGGAVGTGGDGGGLTDGPPCTVSDASDGSVCPCTESSLRCGSTGVPERCMSGVFVPRTPCTAGLDVCQDGACVPAYSCSRLANDCGAGEDCCKAIAVPGGTFDRSNTAGASATVSSFTLDKYEVTVGRFRNFVVGYPGNRPKSGSGKHPLIAGSGWNVAWDYYMPATQDELIAEVGYDSEQGTWTDTPGSNENKPIGNLNWYVAFAFCAWDGGRLPTEAEWNYAAAGGNEQRTYPWGNTVPGADATLAIYGCYYGAPTPYCYNTHIAPVGSAPLGAGKWGHMDLAGNIGEWVLDYSAPYGSSCVDCAQISDDDGGLVWREIRGGYWLDSATYITTEARNYDSPSLYYAPYGVRCAR